ncbi:hypothetical protein BS50DRAFT_582987 [Corynespora cassiicola Philippines]|uniref:C3H1-type domain-containing protein n=1 Tax=Corynespora cassiicola Philippines TaxID=1448308 RepID=A0A2T2P6Z6_CORCC|nr:hypothetical protein BS50DRAFT_582987 [Corynespora cassiicola Philippines]
MASLPPDPINLSKGMRYYILRERDNALVPLVPVDQLPVELVDIPRHLSHRQMSEGHWKFVCETEEPAAKFSIQTSNGRTESLGYRRDAFIPHYLAPDHQINGKSTVTPDDIPQDRWIGLLNSSPPLPNPADSRPVEQRRATFSEDLSHIPHADSFASAYSRGAQRVGYRSALSSGIAPDPCKKEYCTHWIKTGECAFLSQGCRFKHEMPTIEKLKELGFTNGIPKWYQTKTAVSARGPTWMEKRLIQTKSHGSEEIERPSLRVFDPTRLNKVKLNEEHDAIHTLCDSKLQTASTLRQQCRTVAPSPALQPVESSTTLGQIQQHAQTCFIPNLIDMEDPSSSSSTCSTDSLETKDLISPSISPVVTSASVLSSKQFSNHLPKTKLPVLKTKDSEPSSEDVGLKHNPTESSIKRKQGRMSNEPFVSGLAISKHAVFSTGRVGNKYRKPGASARRVEMFQSSKKTGIVREMRLENEKKRGEP